MLIFLLLQLSLLNLDAQELMESGEKAEEEEVEQLPTSHLKLILLFVFELPAGMLSSTVPIRAILFLKYNTFNNNDLDNS